MTTYILIAGLGGLILLLLNALRQDLEEIRQNMERQDRATIELLEHIAGAAEAVKERRSGHE